MKWAELMFYKIKKKLKKPSGQSLIELLVAMGVFILVISGILFLALDSQVANRQGEERTKATGLASEGLEAAKSIKNRGWKYLTNGQHGLTGIGGFWEFAGTENNIEQFNRQVTVENVHRDENGEIVETEGNIDFDTKKISSKINWSFTPERPSQVLLASYLTNWKSTKWFQSTTADFNQGINNPETENVVVKPIGDGALQLSDTTADTSYAWTFDQSADYNYDSQKIEVVNGKAQLKQIAGNVSGQTSNPGFDTGTTSWTYSDWFQEPGDVDVTGDWQSSGGNPGGWTRINIPSGKNYQVGGFWQQSFTLNLDTLTSATASFQWQVPQWKGTPFILKLYVFLDNTVGTPEIGEEIWSSGPISSTMPWSQTVNIDVKNKLSNSGTYYFKLAVWAEAPAKKIAGPFQIGFDNALISWQGTGKGYPTDKPALNPINSFSAANIISWFSFTETAVKNGGEIYYQLSDNNGVSWKYWNGSAWILAGANNYNIASVINTNIASFPVTGSGINFRAFLASNGQNQVSLDNINIGYRRRGYVSSGNFESSVFDTKSTTTNYNYIAWTADVPVGTTLKFQIRAAATIKLLGLSQWVGPDEDSFTYFENPGEIIPDLTNTQYIQYKAYFTSSGQNTAVLKDVTIDYET